MTNDVTDTNVGKMTEQDAIHEIELMEQMECACPDCERRRPALVMAIEALQKQIPIKPIQKESGWYYCPTCDTKVPVSNNFCSGYYRDKIGCGQKLDWRDEE